MQSNKVMLIGFVGQHLITKKLEKGATRVGIRLATHLKQKKETGEIANTTQWHDIVAWNHTAKYAERTLVKGSKILVEGRIEYRTFIDRTGHKRYMTYIYAQDLTNLDR